MAFFFCLFFSLLTWWYQIGAYNPSHDLWCIIFTYKYLSCSFSQGEDQDELVRGTKVYVNIETMTKAHLYQLAGDVIPYLLGWLVCLILVKILKSSEEEEEE